MLANTRAECRTAFRAVLWRLTWSGYTGAMWTRGWAVPAVVLGMLQLGSGCSSSGEDKPVPVGKYCSEDAECSGGFCLTDVNTCSKPCASDSDCASTGAFYEHVCGVAPTGARSCVPPCEAPGYVCVDNVSTSCNVAPDDQCAECGCSGAERCEPEVGCMPKRAAGEPCQSDADCNTNNCSSFAGVCRVPVGSACDASNCDICLSGTDFSYCSRECLGNGACGKGLCLGSGDLYYCRPPCVGLRDESCPGDFCKLFIDDLTNAQSFYCDCASSQKCTWLEDVHPLGTSCRYDSDCAGNLCDRVIIGSDSLAGPSYAGICSQTCNTSAECGEGFTCAAVGTPHCLPTCEGSCATGGNCVGLPSVEGDTTMACWMKRAEGQCWQPGDCQSGNCAGGNCAPAGGQPNGGTCAAPDDCASNSCVGGKCQGLAVLGEACAVPADCAVGTCCIAGPSANTCATTCD